MSFFRSACHEERGNLRLLPRALPGYHLRRENPAQNPLLLLQPHRALSSHRLHGRPWLHPAPGLRREALSGWVFLREKPLFLLIPSEKSRQCAQVGQSISVRPCQSICPTKPFNNTSMFYPLPPLSVSYLNTKASISSYVATSFLRSKILQHLTEMSLFSAGLTVILSLQIFQIGIVLFSPVSTASPLIGDEIASSPSFFHFGSHTIPTNLVL